MKKKVLSVVLAMLMAVAVIPFSAYAADGRSVVDSGNCGLNGDNLKWKLYDDGELVIIGDGEMDWYYEDLDGKLGLSKPAPWSKYFDIIESITINEGVTGVGSYAFVGGNIQYSKISFPKSLKFFEANKEFDGDIFKEIKKYQPEGKHIAFCFSGTRNEWVGVDCKTYNFKFNAQTKEIERTYVDSNGKTLVSHPGSYSQSLEVDNQSQYFEGEEPADFCEIIKKSSSINLDRYKKNQISAHYYNSDKDATLIWTIEGKGSFVDGDAKKMTKGTDVTVKVTGDATLKLQLISADGEVVSEDKAELISFSISNSIATNILMWIMVIIGAIGGTIGSIFKAV